MPKKNGFVYVYTMGYIKNLLDKIQTTGKPTKLTITYVKNSWLLKDAKYSAVLELFREMDFLDQNGAPTNLYSEYQNTTIAKRALGKGMKKAYPTLFAAYPQAFTLPTDQLKGFIKQNSGAEEEIVEKICSTITTLFSMASFDDINDVSVNDNRQNREQDSSKSSSAKINPNLQLNIELHISPDMPEEKIELLFKNMRKYLLSNNE